MALVLADRVREGTNTAGTGTVTLTGAVTGFASFDSQIGNGNTTYYTITDGTNWEVGVGTYNSGTLSRDTVLDSSTGSLVNFAAGFKDVFVTLPAEKVATTDTLGTMSTQNANSVAITGGTATLTSVTTPTVQATNSAGLSLKNSAGTTQMSMGGGGGDNISINVSTNLNGTNAQIDISPTGTGHVHIKPTGVNSVEIAPVSVGDMDNMIIGATTPAAGTFTTLIGGGGSANYFQVEGAATTLAVEAKALGSDTNIAFVIDSKGTGAIDLAAGSSGVNISNGGTVTAITRTVGGTGYTSIPNVAISAPTTAGGVQATASITVMDLRAATIVSGGTGYTVGNVLTVVGGTGTAATLTVSTVSAGVITGVTVTSFGSYTALPSNPVSVTGGTGSGATFTATYAWAAGATLTITNAGSGYVEQPTVTFSGGGGSGAAAYATVGASTIIRSLGVTGTASLDFHTPASATNTVPAFRIRDISVGTSNTGFVQVNNNNGYSSVIAQGPTNANLFIASNGTGEIRFNTNSTNETNQMRVSHTASAVNYVQVTGAATGSGPTISAQGSNADIDFNIAPKGTGNVRFGTYTAGVLTPTGYITIKDSGGTTRRLLVG